MIHNLKKLFILFVVVTFYFKSFSQITWDLSGKNRKEVVQKNLIKSESKYYITSKDSFCHLTVSYDSFGNKILEKMFYKDGSEDFSEVNVYDSNYHLLKKNQNWRVNKVPTTFLYFYDQNGNQVKEETYYGDTLVGTKKITYNDRNQIKNEFFVSINNRPIYKPQSSEYYYNSKGLLKKIIFCYPRLPITKTTLKYKTRYGRGYNYENGSVSIYVDSSYYIPKKIQKIKYNKKGEIICDTNEDRVSNIKYEYKYTYNSIGQCIEKKYTTNKSSGFQITRYYYTQGGALLKEDIFNDKQGLILTRGYVYSYYK